MKATSNDVGWRIAVALMSVVATLLFTETKSKNDVPPKQDSYFFEIVRLEEQILEKAEIIVSGIYELLRDRFQR